MPAILHALARRVPAASTSVGEPAPPDVPRPPGATRPPAGAARGRRPSVALLALTAIFVAVSLHVLRRMIGPIVLASWLVIVAHRPLLALDQALRGRRRAAAALTLLVLLLFLVPLIYMVVIAVSAGMELVASASALLARTGLRGTLAELVRGAPGGGISIPALLGAVRAAGGQVVSALGGAASVLTSFGLQLFVFASALYYLFVDGERLAGWVRRVGPAGRVDTARLGGVYAQMARGMILGVGATAAVQGAVAGIGYVALDVPRAFALAVLTAVAAFIPSVGTALVWAPVTAGLVIAGEPVKAAVMAGVGALTSTADNVLRPLFAHAGRAPLHPLGLLVAILGGVATLGPWGIVLGPLLVALAVEAITMTLEQPHP